MVRSLDTKQATAAFSIAFGIAFVFLVLVTYGPERGSWAPKYLGIHGDGSSTSDEWRLGNAGHEPCEVDESLRRLAWETAQDGELVLTFTDSNYVDLALSWALRARRVGVNNTIIGVLDVESEEALRSRGVPVWPLYNASEPSRHVAGARPVIGSPEFKRINQAKMALPLRFLELGLNVTIMDTDAFLVADPRPFWRLHPELDMLLHVDQWDVGPDPGPGALQPAAAARQVLNVGVLVLRDRSVVRAFMRVWQLDVLAGGAPWEQAVFNEMVRLGGLQLPAPGDPDRAFLGWRKRVRFGILPTASFGSAHTATVLKLHERFGLPQYTLHTTRTYNGAAGKAHRLREAHVYYDPPAYYRGRFLSMDLPPLRLPQGLRSWPVDRTNDMILLHMQGIRQQLQHVRMGLALAQALNRTFIFPRIRCLCDQHWTSAPFCKFSSAAEREPVFDCPLDGLMHMDVLSKQLDAKLYGPPIQFREYSFLENPEYPGEAAGDVVVVADSTSAAHGVNSVVLPVHSTAPGVAAGLANLTDVRRLHFPHPEHVWGGFGDNATEAAFDLRFHESLDSFCCWSRQGQATKASYAEFFYRTDEQALGLDA